jgi:leukotriene-A4 hydrolase
VIKFKIIDEEPYNRVILDTKGLKINEVLDQDDSLELKWSIYTDHPAREALGDPLIILIPEEKNKVGNCLEINIVFSSTEDSPAIQWFEKEQTRNKDAPFMFTQCQAILARSLLPCQDTPGAKITVEAKLTVAKPFVALYSGIQVTSYDDPYNSELTVYEYVQNIPVPSYLIAIACGKLEYGKLSERCGVWTEIGLRDKAVYEFEDTEKYLTTAENYLTPYRWGVYNILVLPFSFPYGGMENPCLTFLNPCLINGDKSMANVVAHEIAHSWTGNLVTNKDWTNFWLNEGFTTFLERKICELIYGEDMAHLEANVGKGELAYAIQSMGPTHSYSSLMPDLTNVDPDDAFSVVPYEKGYTLLYFLEQLIGKQHFQKMLQSYIEIFALKAIAYEDFRSHFENYVKETHGSDAEGLLSQIDWETWVRSPGQPVKNFDYPSKLKEEGEAVAKRVLHESYKLTSDDAKLFKNWHTNVKLVFLNYLNENCEKLTDDAFANLRDCLGLHSGYNVEVSYIWYQIALKMKKDCVIEHVRQFLLSNGRMKYIRPIYILYYQFKKDEALDLFDKNK